MNSIFSFYYPLRFAISGSRNAWEKPNVRKIEPNSPISNSPKWRFLLHFLRVTLLIKKDICHGALIVEDVKDTMGRKGKKRAWGVKEWNIFFIHKVKGV